MWPDFGRIAWAPELWRVQSSYEKSRSDQAVTAAINASIIRSACNDYPNIRLILNHTPTIDFIESVSVENFHSVAVLRMISARVG